MRPGRSRGYVPAGESLIVGLLTGEDFDRLFTGLTTPRSACRSGVATRRGRNLGVNSLQQERRRWAGGSASCATTPGLTEYVLAERLGSHSRRFPRSRPTGRRLPYRNTRVHADNRVGATSPMTRLAWVFLVNCFHLDGVTVGPARYP
jgi:hypothetical protein